jgi:hypothetical protein
MAMSTGLGFAWLGLAAAAPTAPVAFWVRIDDPATLPATALPTGEFRTGPTGREWRVLVRDRGALRGLPTRPAPADPPPEGWPGPEDVVDHLLAAVARSPRAGSVTLGWSLEGAELVGAWFGRPPEDGAPVVRVLGGHHGDEPPSVAVALAVVDALADGDGADDGITSLLDRATVWVVPCVNPDGLRAAARVNARSVDLNRNYGYGWQPGSWSGSAAFSEPETRAVRGLGDRARPLVSLSLHTGAENLGWPWNHSLDAPPDAAVFRSLADTYVAHHPDPGFWVTQGSRWYRTAGDTNDWAYGRFGALDLTLELSTAKAPPADQLPALLDTHLDAILATLSTPPTFEGRVTDESGRPLEARIHVEGARDTWSDPATGRFARLLTSAPETFEVDAPGYGAVTARPGEDVVLPATHLALREVVVVRGWWTPFDGAAGLIRAGEEPAAPGDVAGLASGAWSVEGDDGTVWPRAVLVEDPGDQHITGRVRTAGGVRWDGAVGRGARGFAIREGLLEEVAVRVTPGGLEVSAAPPVLLYAGGAVLAATEADLARERTEPELEPLVVAGGCAAAPIRGNLVLVALSVLVVGSAARTPRRCG